MEALPGFSVVTSQASSRTSWLGAPTLQKSRQGSPASPASLLRRRCASREAWSVASTRGSRSLALRATDGAASQTEASPTASSVATPPDNSGKDIVPDAELSITKTSFGTIGLTVGVSLLVYGFGAYFTLLPGADFSAIMLTYGFPLTIIGFALKYAELKPVPCTSYADAVALRDKEATPILLQVRSDVIRYRYGDEQHLDEALKRVFRYNQAGGIQRRNAPTLTAISEEVYDGHYSLVLHFSAPSLKLSDFTERQAKFTSFFGPGVNATVEDVGQNQFNVRLTATPN